jgi:hypothetical protein
MEHGSLPVLTFTSCTGPPDAGEINAVDEFPVLIIKRSAEYLARNASLRRGHRLGDVDFGKLRIPCRLTMLVVSVMLD